MALGRYDMYVYIEDIINLWLINYLMPFNYQLNSWIKSNFTYTIVFMFIKNGQTRGVKKIPVRKWTLW